MRDPNHQATFSLFLAFQVTFFTATIFYYLFNQDQMRSDWDLFSRMFSPIEAAILLEVAGTAAVLLLLLPAVRIRGSFTGSSMFYYLLVTITLSVIIVLPLTLRNFFQTHPVLSCGMCMQQIRFLMKIVSFLVEDRVLREETEDPITDNNNSGDKVDPESQTVKQKPTFKSLMYFMFAPTLIYRQSYPKHPDPTNWLMVIAYLLQWLLLFFPMTILVNHQMFPLWYNIGRVPLTTGILYKMFLWTTCMSAFLWFGIGYCFLHCWLNMFAEILRFGDRLFYKNWWSATNGLHAWSLWNYMIHLWIARYIFVPCIRATRSRIFSVLVTFALSAFFHDYLISFAMGFFFPYLLMVVVFIVTPATPVLMILNYILKFIPLPSTNIHVFATALLSITIGMMAAAFEYNSRITCPLTVTNDSYVTTLLVPRSFSCVSFDFSVK
jgi:sterol O-acyltransferase